MKTKAVVVRRVEHKGAKLAREWGLDVRQALYSEWGNFYGLLTRFPSAFIDPHGYFLIADAAALDVEGISVGRRINIPGRISNLPGYVRVASERSVDVARVPEEIDPAEPVWEGAKERIVVNRYERSAEGRRQCLEHWKARCVICGFDFAERYGPEFEGIIHVHHIRGLATIGEAYVLDAVADLRPVCPNCHAALHYKRPAEPRSVEDLQRIVGERA